MKALRFIISDLVLSNQTMANGKVEMRMLSSESGNPIAVGGHPVSESTASSYATMALSTNRKTMDGDKEFEMLKTKLLQAPL